MPTVVLEGSVFSGRGEGKRFIELPWVRRQIEEKLGFSPFSGTLNLRLTDQSTKLRGKLEDSKGIKIEPAVGYFPGFLFKAQIEGLDCAVVLPQVSNYPSDILEVLAPMCLRKKFGLADGSTVAVCVSV